MEISNEIINRDKNAFAMGLRLIALEHVKTGVFRGCEGYQVIDNELYLSRYSDKAIKFPYAFDIEQTIEFAWGWFKSTKPSYPEPNTDGSTYVGFELSTKRSGCGSQDWGMFASVRPIWLVFGK